jgi:hypothetical protein
VQMKRIWITCLLSLMAFCACQHKNAGFSKTTSSGEKSVSIIDSILNMADSIDASIKNKEVFEAKLNYPYDTSSSNIVLYYNKNFVVKLVYPIVGITGVYEKYGQYYFDKNGSAFLKKEPDSNNSVIQSYIDFNKHKIYEGINRKMENLSNPNKYSSDKECRIIQEIDYFMQFYSYGKL